MSDSLNYQPSNSAVYYTPPKRIDILRTVLGFVGAAVAAAVGGFIYGQIQPGLHSFYVRVGAVVVAAGVTGLLGLLPIRFGKIRIPLVAAFIGTVIAMIALYAMWLSWVDHVLTAVGAFNSYRVLILHPVTLLRIVKIINRTGTWSHNGYVINGVMLLIYWLCEAGLILGAGVLIPVNGLFSSDPACRDCGSRCVRISSLPRFATDRQEDFVNAIENRDFASLPSHAAPDHADAPELSIRLMSCPKCGNTHVLTISRIAWGVDFNGHRKVTTTSLVNGLLVTQDEAEQLIDACVLVKKQRAFEQEEKKGEEPAAD
jgi:hypothetical protein